MKPQLNTKKDLIKNIIHAITNPGKTIKLFAKQFGFRHWNRLASNTVIPIKPATLSLQQCFQEVNITCRLQRRWDIRIGGRLEKAMDDIFLRNWVNLSSSTTWLTKSVKPGNWFIKIPV